MIWSQLYIKILGVYFFNSVLDNNNWDIVYDKQSKYQQTRLNTHKISECFASEQNTKGVAALKYFTIRVKLCVSIFY